KGNKHASAIRTNEVARGDLDRNPMAVLVQYGSVDRSGIFWSTQKPGLITLHVFRSKQLGVMKGQKFREAPAAESYRRRVRVDDHPRRDLRNQRRVAHPFQCSKIPNHQNVLSPLKSSYGPEFRRQLSKLLFWT